MFDILKSGGILMIPIILCGLISSFIIVERIIYFISIKSRDKKLMKSLEESLGKDNYEHAIADCIIASTPCSQVIKKVIECKDLDEDHRKELVQTLMDSVVSQFERFLTALGTIANISTLLGLLGTVTGNIKAFGVLGSGGTMGDPSLLASSIAEALVTTVAGLCVAIPSLIFNNHFNSEVDHRIADM